MGKIFDLITRKPKADPKIIFYCQWIQNNINKHTTPKNVPSEVIRDIVSIPAAMVYLANWCKCYKMNSSVIPIDEKAMMRETKIIYFVLNIESLRRNHLVKHYSVMDMPLYKIASIKDTKRIKVQMNLEHPFNKEVFSMSDSDRIEWAKYNLSLIKQQNKEEEE
jgi:hypothetical protein